MSRVSLSRHDVRTTEAKDALYDHVMRSIVIEADAERTR
jgi:hypothetical protein